MKSLVSLLLLIALLCCCPRAAIAQDTVPRPQKVIFDTDIGDDIDDAFALGLLLSNPEVEVLGVTTDYGNTDLRARLVERYLCSVGKSDIPVAAGPRTPAKSVFTQARWAKWFPDRQWPDAIDFTLNEIRKYPGQVTLISVSPLSNVGALIDRDPATFRKLKRVVIMGGSIRRGYGDLGYRRDRGPDPEYNILMDIPAAQKLFASRVPLYVMPLDSTQLKLDETRRNVIFSESKPLTDTLALLYHDWTASTLNPTPTLFDAMAAAYTLRPDLCPTTPMHIVVDDKGFTREEPGPANAQVCLQSNPNEFFKFYIHWILKQNLQPVPAQGCKATVLP
ncbi:MAG: nucleoside hydrolase [Acidobacteriaceae bacterium]